MPARIERDRATARFVFSYDEKVIAELKAKIASRFRSYDPPSRSWTISEPMVDAAIEVVLARFGKAGVAVIDNRGRSGTEEAEKWRKKYEAERLRAERAERRSSAGVGRSTSGDWAQQLYDALPEAMRDNVYRRLMPALHPDTNGGDPAAVAASKALNAVFRAPKGTRR